MGSASGKRNLGNLAELEISDRDRAQGQDPVAGAETMAEDDEATAVATFAAATEAAVAALAATAEAAFATFAALAATAEAAAAAAFLARASAADSKRCGKAFISLGCLTE